MPEEMLVAKGGQKNNLTSTASPGLPQHSGVAAVVENETILHRSFRLTSFWNEVPPTTSRG